MSVAIVCSIVRALEPPRRAARSKHRASFFELDLEDLGSFIIKSRLVAEPNTFLSEYTKGALFD